ncbi:Ankyrin repeat-containing domain [Phytophthora cactorum]|nr:Ankyrin repeat-containing domain [Phytophthora cactorum]
MDNAAYYGHIEVVKWLHDNRREGCTVDAMNLAARNGHLDVVKWLHLNRTEGCTTAAMDCAADRGHLDVVQWLAENRSEGCTTIALDGAVINKHRAVADWLLRNRSEGGTAAIMAAIAARGDIEAVYWCHFVAQVTYDATAADAAVRTVTLPSRGSSTNTASGMNVTSFGP